MKEIDKLKYADEYLAMWILKMYFPMCQNLDKNERPDLYDKLGGVGVEVTDACGEKWHKDQMIDIPLFLQTKQYRKNPLRHDLNGQFYAKRFERIRERLKTKLNKGYIKEKILGLYMFSDITKMTDKVKNDLYEMVTYINFRHNLLFDFLIIHQIDDDNLIVCDFKKNSFYDLKIDPSLFVKDYNALLEERLLK